MDDLGWTDDRSMIGRVGNGGREMFVIQDAVEHHDIAQYAHLHAESKLEICPKWEGKVRTENMPRFGTRSIVLEYNSLKRTIRISYSF